MTLIEKLERLAEAIDNEGALLIASAAATALSVNPTEESLVEAVAAAHVGAKISDISMQMRAIIDSEKSANLFEELAGSVARTN